MNNMKKTICYLCGLMIIFAVAFSGCKKQVIGTTAGSEMSAKNMAWGTRRTVDTSDEYIFATAGDDKSYMLYRVKKDGSDKTEIFSSKYGYISMVNAVDGWVFFSLEELNMPKANKGRLIRSYSICKIRYDGSDFQKIRQVRVSDMQVHDDKVYFSRFKKIGPSGIYSVDFEGANESLIFNGENICFDIVENKMQVVCLGDLYDDEQKCEIYEIGLDEQDVKKISTIKDVLMYEAYLIDNDIFYIGEKGALYSSALDGLNIRKLAADVEGGFSICDGWIYYVGYDEGGPKLTRVRLDGEEHSTIIKNKGINALTLNGIFDGWVYCTEIKTNTKKGTVVKNIRRISVADNSVDEIIQLNETRMKNVY